MISNAYTPKMELENHTTRNYIMLQTEQSHNKEASEAIAFPEILFVNITEPFAFVGKFDHFVTAKSDLLFSTPNRGGKINVKIDFFLFAQKVLHGFSVVGLDLPPPLNGCPNSCLEL